MQLLFIILAAMISNSKLTVTSSAFKSGEKIPEKYSCEGQNINPPIFVQGIPDKTVSLALIMFDPDAPNGGFDHWILFNMNPGDNRILENSAPGTQGANGKGKSEYGGPCPPTGIHHYHFTVYALDKKLDLEVGTTKQDVESAMKDHILAQGELVGLYTKKKKTENN